MPSAACQGNLTLFHRKLLALRLGFIVAFEHVVFVRLLVWLVPDVPAALVTKIKREHCLVVQEPADNRVVPSSQRRCPQSPGLGASEAGLPFKNPRLPRCFFLFGGSSASGRGSGQYLGQRPQGRPLNWDARIRAL
ncbi:unnamed protein product [Gulo gulo]|uniref:Anoctamin n=1 Tax=Gulo gulo TaxID=48420 RepID=A0A9X9LM49_GULGU|nr:unnamed protein product [Gulo gulo]